MCPHFCVSQSKLCELYQNCLNRVFVYENYETAKCDLKIMTRTNAGDRHHH